MGTTELPATKIAWKNGRYIPASQAVLPVEDVGIVHGVCITEMMRTFSGRIYEAGRHLNRLMHSAGLTGIPIQFSPDEIRNHLNEIVAHNQKLLPGWQEQGLIIFATPGINSTYTGKIVEREPTLFIHTFDLPGELWSGAIAQGQHLAVSTVPQVPDECLPVTVKYRSRLAFYLADSEVQKRYPDARAILLNVDGDVRETGAANLFLVRNHQLWTAPRDTVLPGISREIVIEMAKELGIEVLEKNFSPAELESADEIFTTSTPYCLLGVSRLNEQKLSDDFPGEITRLILESWNKRLGVDIHAQLLEIARHRKAAAEV